MANKQNYRFGLLPYQTLARRWMIPAILLIPAGYGLTVSVQHIEIFNPLSAELGWVISIVGVLLTLYSFGAIRSHVTFKEDRFILRTPIHPLAVSYKRIKIVHPIELRLLFPRKGMRRGLYRLYRKLWNRTVPVVMLEGLPLPRWWLKLWIHPLLVHPDDEGIILVVKDWIACTRALDTMRTDATKAHWKNLG